MSGAWRQRLLAATIIAGGMVAAAAAQAMTWQQYALQTESTGNFQAVNNTSTALGGFQMTQAALVQAGYIRENTAPTAANYGGNWSNVTWTGKDGITSTQQYLNSPQAQTNAATTFSTQNWQNYGLQQYVGKTVNGQTLNEAALVDGAYFAGPGGLKDYIATGAVHNADGSVNVGVTSILQNRIRNASQVDASAITGANTLVAQGGSPNDTGAPGTPSFVSPVFCDQSIAQVLTQGANAAVQSQVSMAEQPQTGFTLMNGNTVLQAAGLSPGASDLGGPTGSFGEFSCLTNLLNGTFDVIFDPPNLDSIISGLANMVCNKAQSLVTQVTQPLQQSLFQTASVGGFFPGSNLGSLGGGLQTSYAQSGQPGVNVGVGGMGGSASLLGGSGTAPTTSYFGNGLLGSPGGSY